MRDSYKAFVRKFDIQEDELIQFGLDETIYASFGKAKEQWEKLKHKILNNETVYMRGFGRNGMNSHLYKDIYAGLVKNYNVTTDRTGNSNPRTVIQDLTGYSAVHNTTHTRLLNYQTSHIFGRSKNIFAFTAPWNIAHIPTVINPLSGHQASNPIVEKYIKMFQNKSFRRFESLIEEYNQLMTDNKFRDTIAAHLDLLSKKSPSDAQKLAKSIKEQFAPIAIRPI